MSLTRLRSLFACRKLGGCSRSSPQQKSCWAAAKQATLLLLLLLMVLLHLEAREVTLHSATGMGQQQQQQVDVLPLIGLLLKPTRHTGDVHDSHV
jgi:hypothetical protein